MYKPDNRHFLKLMKLLAQFHKPENHLKRVKSAHDASKTTQTHHSNQTQIDFIEMFGKKLRSQILDLP